MNEQFSHEQLEMLIENVKMARPEPPVFAHTATAWEQEIKYHPDRFYLNSHSELMYLGCKVCVIGTSKNGAEKLIKTWNKYKTK